MTVTDMAQRVKDAKQLAKIDPVLAAVLLDRATWDFADAILAETPTDKYGEAEHGVHTGVRAALDDIERRLHGEWKMSTLRVYRSTAIAWPEGKRFPSEQASFTAHLRLKGRDDRVAIMRKLLDKSKNDENPEGYVSYKLVNRWAADQRGYRVETPWLESMRRGAHNWMLKAETAEARHQAAEAWVLEAEQLWGCTVKIQWPDD